MKKNYLLLALFAMLLSCTNESVFDIEDNKADPELRTAGDGRYDVLGFGYDVTKDYFDYSGASSVAVIDVQAIAKAYPTSSNTGIITASPNTRTTSQVVGETATQFSTQLTANSKISAKVGIFGGSLSTNFGSSENYDSKYSIASYQSFFRYKQLTIGLTPKEILPYLTVQFKNDLNNLSSIELVQKYGTHVLTDITLGARLQIMYKAQSLSTNKTSSIEASLNATISLFSSESKITYNKNLATQNKDYRIVYKGIGGDIKKMPGSGIISVDPTALKEINVGSWVESINPSNYRFIDSKPGTLIPIYEFIQDPVKKASIASAVDKYIRDGAINANSSYTRQDWSGLVEIIILKKEITGQHPTTYVDIPSDYVLIGGGAKVSNVGKNGALLTQSYPSSDLTRWYGASKDHKKASNHKLEVFAVGLKLKGISRDQLKQYMVVTSSTSAKANHPATQANLPSGYTLIGGGAKVNWTGDGSLLVKSIPNGNAWAVSGKDHITKSPATVTAYAIGIKPNITSFGTLEISRESASKWVSQLGTEITQSIDSDWLISCPGGEATFAGKGRMLTILYPDFRHVTIGSSDHLDKDSGNTILYMLKIRKKKQ